jgi:hypothetical protein
MRIDHTEQPDISPQGWLLASLKAISTGNASFSPMAASLGEIHIQSLSRPAPHQRMNPKVIDFLQTVLRHVALCSVTESRPEGNDPFRRTLWEHATQLRMHPNHQESFRAVANNSDITSGRRLT